MSEAQEWTEELVAEYYELQGYIVLRNLPTFTGKGGGRSEADVIAFRQKDGRLEIWDIEVGTYYEKNSNIVAKMRKKFSEKREKIVPDFIGNRTGLKKKLPVNYKRLFVDSSWPKEEKFKNLKEALKRYRIETTTLENVVAAIPNAIEVWKLNNMTEKGSRPALPKTLKYMKIVEECSYVWNED